MSPIQISNFLDGAIRNRISVRLMAEQHITLSQAFDNPNADRSYVGVVDPKCAPKAMIKMCGSFVSELCEATLGTSPSIIIDGGDDATFPYVPPPRNLHSLTFFLRQLRSCPSRIYLD